MILEDNGCKAFAFDCQPHKKVAALDVRALPAPALGKCRLDHALDARRRNDPRDGELVGARYGFECAADRPFVDAEADQRSTRRAVWKAEQSEQQMLGADVRASRALGLLLPKDKCPFSILAERFEGVLVRHLHQVCALACKRTLVCGPGTGQNGCGGNSLDLFAPATRDWFRGSFD